MTTKSTDGRGARMPPEGEAGNVVEPVRRGPRPRLTVDLITRAAIELADAEGLAAASMRRVADRLGVSGMSLYTYLPGKAELLDLMVDAAHAEIARPCCDRGTWRTCLESVAHANRTLYLRHPWLLQVGMSRPAAGPHTAAKRAYELAAVAGSGLARAESELVIETLNSYVAGAVRSAMDARPASTGPDSITGGGPARAFDFGLGLLLDGIAARLERCAAGAGDRHLPAG